MIIAQLTLESVLEWPEIIIYLIQNFKKYSTYIPLNKKCKFKRKNFASKCDSVKEYIDYY